MKPFVVLSVNAIILIVLILWSIRISNRLDDINFEYNAVYNGFSELDQAYFPKLTDINIEIAKDLNQPAFRQLPDSIKIKLKKQKTIGSFFFHYRMNTDWAFSIIKVGLEEQLISLQVLAIISVLSLTFNSSYIFLSWRKSRH